MTRRTTASAKRAAPSSPPNADPAVPLPARREGFRPVLTICCITFNHERYIAQALDGFLKQRTDFPVEIIVHDDCSTDRTASIVRDYQNRHPGLIRAVLRVENQYAQGKRIMPMFADWVDGEFVAVCEGDDFWTDPEKLQRQVDYLRTHPKAAGCFHDTSVVDDEGKVIADSYFDSQRISFSRHDVLATLLSREPTCSLVFRRTVFAPPLPAWYLRRPSDLYLDLLITEYGTFDFIRRNMGSYRRHASGVWSRESPSTQLVELIHRLMLLQEDRGFRERHAGVLQKKIGELRKSLFTREELKAEFARIERIAAEQAHYIEKLIEERDRAHLQIGATRAESSKAREDAARQQAAIKRELDQLAATSQEQTAYIKVLESERDRLASEADAARKQSR
jgi:glycosyltransferase involved in cell wall biosynthesis